MASKVPVVEFYQSRRSGGAFWRWRMIARNGVIIVASSEDFTSRRNAERNFTTVSAAFADRVEIRYAD